MMIGANTHHRLLITQDFHYQPKRDRALFGKCGAIHAINKARNCGGSAFDGIEDMIHDSRGNLQLTFGKMSADQPRQKPVIR